MKETIMIIGAGPMQVHAIRIAKEMGLDTLVTDYNPTAPGLALADIPVVMSTKDIEGSVRTAREYRRIIGGVMTVGTDASMTVAAVAGSLGLPGIYYEAAENATNKAKMRARLSEKGVPVPEFRGVWDLNEAREAAEDIGWPVVVKPCDNMGARGVTRVDDPGEMEERYRHARAHSTSGEVVVEAFMEGPEVSIDALVFEGEVILWGIADREITGSPYFVEMGHTLPSALPPEVQERVKEVMAAAIDALEIRHGAAKGDVKITRDGPKIGEIAARLSGGWMSTHTYPLSTGYSMIRGAIEIAMGRRPEIPPLDKRIAMEHAFVAPPGRITAIEGMEAARKIPGVADVIRLHRIGDYAAPLTSNMGKSGNIIAVAEDRAECAKIVKRALSLIRIEVAEKTPVTIETARDRAREKLGHWCRVCRVCDGNVCAGWVPGIGGLGTGGSFMNNIAALAAHRLRQRVIHDKDLPDIRTTFLSIPLSIPVIGAPMTGANTNLGGAVTEEEMASSLVKGAIGAGTITCLGDGASPEKYMVGINLLASAGGRAIPIFKPRPREEVMKRIRAARAAGAVAVGMDVDAASFTTMKSRGQAAGPKGAGELEEIIREAGLPFVVKGIMDPSDAIKAASAGASALVVSNHGGRTMDHMPGSAEVLPAIRDAVGDDMPLVLDGGIRTGEDVVKALALGADICMIGRPVLIAAVGMNAAGVELFWKDLAASIERVMILTGVASIGEITEECLADPIGS